MCIRDRYLYSIAASLPGGDAVAVHFGCRKIAFKPDTGFWLNGRNVRLVGAARHQDRAGLGNALTAAEHEEDMQILRDMGANTVRLAHYQHAQYFYDLCDKYGLVEMCIRDRGASYESLCPFRESSCEPSRHQL